MRVATRLLQRNRKRNLRGLHSLPILLPLVCCEALATALGDIYYWGKSVAVDYPQAMAAYKIGAKASDKRELCEY